MKENFHGRANISSEYEDMKWHWYLPKQTTASHSSTLRRALLQDSHCFCRERCRHFQFLLPTSPATTGQKTLVANVLSALYVPSEADKLKVSFFFVFAFLFSRVCVRVSSLLAGQTQSMWKRKDDLQPAILLAVSVSVNHSAHQNSSFVARYTGYPAKHIPLDSRIVPELWMPEISTVIRIQTVAVTVTWSLFYLLISIHTSVLEDRKEHLLQMCCAWLDTYS